MSGHGQDDGGRSSLPEQLHAHLHRGPGTSSGTSSPAPVSQQQTQAPPQQHPHSQLSTPHPPALSAEYAQSQGVPVGYPIRQQQQEFTPHEDPSRAYYSQPQQQQQQYGYQPQQQPQQPQPHAGPSGWRQEQTLGYGEQYGWRPPAQAESYARRGGNEPHDAGFGARDMGFGSRPTGFGAGDPGFAARDTTYGFGTRRGYSLQGYSNIRSSRSPPPPLPPTQQPGYGGLPSMAPSQQQHPSYYTSSLDDPHATSSTPFTGFLPNEHTLGYSGYDRYPQSDLRLPQPGTTGREDVQYGHPLPPGLLGLSSSYGSHQSMLSSPAPSNLAGPSTTLTGPGSSIASSSQGSLLGASSDPLGFPSSYDYASDPEPIGTLRTVGSTPTPVGIPVGTPRGSSSAGGSSGRRAEDDDEGKPSKKRKVEIACNFCRQRKLKCSGTKPACDACIKRDQAERCQYEAFPRRRGPGKAPRGTRRTTHRSRTTGAEAQSQGFGIMSPTMSQAGPSSQGHSSRSQAPLSSQGSYGQPQQGPSFVQMTSQGYGQPRAGPSSQPMVPSQTPGPSDYGGYGVLPAPGYTVPSPIAPPSLGPYVGSMGTPGPSGEEQRRRAEQQRQYEEEQRQFKEEPHGY